MVILTAKAKRPGRTVMRPQKQPRWRVTIPCSDELLLSLKESRTEFETEARLLLAVKLYELNRVSTGIAAQLAGMTRVQFMFVLDKFGLSPFGVDPEELAGDFDNA